MNFTTRAAIYLYISMGKKTSTYLANASVPNFWLIFFLNGLLKEATYPILTLENLILN
jgi:hypothetical protein